MRLAAIAPRRFTPCGRPAAVHPIQHIRNDSVEFRAKTVVAKGDASAEHPDAGLKE
jgi:hypothetical protein